MDVIIEIFLDFFCEVYFDLLENLLPDKNIFEDFSFSNKYRRNYMRSIWSNDID